MTGLRKICQRLVPQVVLAMAISMGGSGLGAAGELRIPFQGTYAANSQWRELAAVKTEGWGYEVNRQPSHYDVSVELVRNGVSVKEMLRGEEGPVTVESLAALYGGKGKFVWDGERSGYETYVADSYARIGTTTAVEASAWGSSVLSDFQTPGPERMNWGPEVNRALKSGYCSSERNWRALEAGEIDDVVKYTCSGPPVQSAWIGKILELGFWEYVRGVQLAGFDARAMGDLPEWKKRYEEELFREEPLLKEKTDERFKKAPERQSYFLDDPATGDKLFGVSAWNPWAAANSLHGFACADYCAAFMMRAGAMDAGYRLDRIR